MNNIGAILGILRIIGQRSTLLLAILLWLGDASIRADEQTGKWGDQGDSTFRNPILAADYSDPDVIRVGEDFYMIASTFEASPGIPVLHSKDLVNWESIGAVFKDVSKLGPDFNWDTMNRYGKGIFAPSIRYHDGKFWIFVNCHSGEGFYMATAKNPAGPWTVTQIKDKNGKPLRTGGWTDPCPFWDDDGKAYLASSRPGSQWWFGYLFEMTPDGAQLLDADVEKMKVNGVKYAYPEGGTLFSPFHSTEGHKLYKRNGYYYLVHIEFTDKGQGHGTYVMRSKNFYGTKPDGTPGKPGDPGKYDILKFGKEIPGQGGLVDTPDGRWFWLAQFNRYGSDGRTPHLVPVTWMDDWPVPGVDIKDKQGKMVWQMKKPILGQPIQFPQGSDEFDRPTISPQWMWNHQPRRINGRSPNGRVFSRLYAFKPLESGNFFKAGNTINQRYLRSDLTTATAKIELGGMADGQEAGITHFNSGINYATLGVVQIKGVNKLKCDADGKILEGDALPKTAATIWLRSTIGFDDIIAHAYSTDGKMFTKFGNPYKLKSTSSHFRGYMVGLYTFNNDAEAGYVDIDFFHYTSQNR